jgi:CBS domain-containing protein
MSSSRVPSGLLRISRTPPVCVSAGATVEEATRLMVQYRVGAIAVIRDDVLVGIVTERDLMVKITNEGVDPARVKVDDVMEDELVTVTPDASYREAAHLMLAHHCRHLPITDVEGQILGMLSIRHLYREQLRRLQGQMDSLESYMGADGPGG